MTYTVHTDSGDTIILPYQCASCQRIPPTGSVHWSGRTFCDQHCQNSFSRSESRNSQISYQEGLLNVRPERES